MVTPPTAHLNERARGWLRHLWRKAMTPDDWSREGEPHPWWDRYSFEPMLSFPRFDLSESSCGLLLMSRKTPAWSEVYTKILDELIRRHTTFWAAVDWLTQIGPDPDRARYPKRYKRLIPKDLWGDYDVPGWTANGVEPWGLQPDPIGADGFLFFRGFFTLLLGIHRAVSGETTWERPFEMAGLDDRTFPWTHSRIAAHLAEQWERVPDGPHCENTKVWPYCLSAAGLGLQMTDLTTGSHTHHVYDRWVEDVFRKRFMAFDGRGNLKGVGLYYDPVLERLHGNHRAFGLAPAFYAVPQNRPLAELLYRNAVAAVGWDRRWLPVLNPGGEPRLLSLALLMAREFGDHTTARRVEKKLAGFENGRFFDTDTDVDGRGTGDPDEFGFFFRYGEPHPRGQESALLMLRDLLDGEADWFHAFNGSYADKLLAPAVEDVDFPKLGLARAWNDESAGTLSLETYAATTRERGTPTRFRVVRLPDASAVSVLRDGAPYGQWRALGPDAIEIDSEVADHGFEIHTGYRSAAVRQRPERPAHPGAVVQGGGPAAPRVRASDLATAGAAVVAGNLGCPCCA